MLLFSLFTKLTQLEYSMGVSHFFQYCFSLTRSFVVFRKRVTIFQKVAQKKGQCKI